MVKYVQSHGSRGRLSPISPSDTIGLKGNVAQLDSNRRCDPARWHTGPIVFLEPGFPNRVYIFQRQARLQIHNLVYWWCGPGASSSLWIGPSNQVDSLAGSCIRLMCRLPRSVCSRHLSMAQHGVVAGPQCPSLLLRTTCRQANEAAIISGSWVPGRSN